MKSTHNGSEQLYAKSLAFSLQQRVTHEICYSFFFPNLPLFLFLLYTHARTFHISICTSNQLIAQLSYFGLDVTSHREKIRIQICYYKHLLASITASLTPITAHITLCATLLNTCLYLPGDDELCDNRNQVCYTPCPVSAL